MSIVTQTAPGPRPRLPATNLIRMSRNRLGFWQEIARQYGDVAGVRFGSEWVFLLNHPDYIKDVLVTNSRLFHKGRGLEKAKRVLGDGLLTSEDPLHLRQRRLAQPAFHKQRVTAYGDTMIAYAGQISADWQDGATLDIAHEMMRLTLAIVGKTLFDTDVTGETDEIGQALTDLISLFTLFMLPFSDLLEKLPIPPTRRFLAARSRLDSTIYRMVNERRATGEDKGDLLSMLLLAQDNEGDGGGMSDRQVRDEAMTIFLAGHETTANVLTWTWYLLSKNPTAEARLHHELDRVLGGRPPTVADLPALPYTERVLAESMRLYPPAWIVGRRALADYPVGPYVVPAGSVVLMSQYLMHHDARYFPDPERFDPDRWTPQARESRPKFSYFPFGGGPRLCIGEAFAWMEAELLLASLAQHWQMRLAPDQTVELQPLVTLRPKGGLRMRLERRPVV